MAWCMVNRRETSNVEYTVLNVTWCLYMSLTEISVTEHWSFEVEVCTVLQFPAYSFGML